MPHLLRIDSSISPNSFTREIADVYEGVWSARGGDYTVGRRDLAANPLPHLASSALHWPERLRQFSPDVPEQEALQAEILAEIAAADVLLIGAPMYNYAMPSQLKAWVDFIHVPGLTTPFDSDTQPFAGKVAVIVSARGGAYDPGSPEEAMDHVIPPLRLVLEGSLGMSIATIVTNRTLAETIPSLEIARSQEELRLAKDAAEAHARTVLLP